MPSRSVSGCLRNEPKGGGNVALQLMRCSLFAHVLKPNGCGRSRLSLKPGRQSAAATSPHRSLHSSNQIQVQLVSCGPQPEALLQRDNRSDGSRRRPDADAAAGADPKRQAHAEAALGAAVDARRARFSARRGAELKTLSCRHDSQFLRAGASATGRGASSSRCIWRSSDPGASRRSP